MYADDTTLFCDINGNPADEHVLNTELCKITDWLSANKLSLNVNKTKCMVFPGAYAGFLRGGAQLSIFWDFGYTCREAACCEQRSCEPLLGGFGGMPPKKIFKNGAISCVLRAIFNHFHGKKPLKKL